MSTTRERSLVVGASAGLGRAIAQRLAEAGHALCLLASDLRDLDPLACDLHLRFDVPAFAEALDLARPFDADALRLRVVQRLGGLDNLLLVAGRVVVDGDPVPLASHQVQELIRVNFAGPVEIANAFLADLVGAPHGNCVAIGSVGATRARGRHQVYGACKRGLEFYAQALRHHLAPTRCRVQCYRLGYLRTAMTFGKRLALPAVDPDRAAATIVRGLGQDRGVRFVPWWWRPIMLAYQAIPWPLYRRLSLA